jgi:hypothetical protein
MTVMPQFHFVQERGAWIAHCDDPGCIALLETSTVPVMRDFGDGQWTWRNPVLFNGNPDQFGRPWWNDAGQKRWRGLLLERPWVLVRRATAPTAEAPTGSVGKPIGLFRTDEVAISEHRMTLKLLERVAEAI